MIEARYYDRNLTIKSTVNNIDCSLKVDTGAQLTIMSINKLVAEPLIHTIVNKLESKLRVLAYSASGHELKGVFCKFENVLLDDTKLEFLYVGLILNSSIDKALLGLDFLQGCTFSHSAGGNMFIESVDCSYQEKVIKDIYGDCDEIYTIDEILSMCNIEDSLSILKSLI